MPELPLAHLELDPLQLLTPNGNLVDFLVRRGTNDHNTVYSVMAADEYQLKGLSLDGWALDIGAHVGSVGIALAIDNPQLQVVAVEPVPDNAELCRRNAERNGVADRYRVLEAAAGPAGTTTEVRYGFIAAGGGEEFDHHAWVGNTSLVYADPPVESFMSVEVPCLDLAELAREYSGPPCWVKVDCEGGEWDALPQLVGLAADTVVGEWHPVLGRQSADELVAAFLAAGYRTEVSGPAGGPGNFFATR